MDVTGLVDASGAPLVAEREQETWSGDEWKNVDKTMTFARRRGLIFQLFCDHAICQDANAAKIGTRAPYALQVIVSQSNQVTLECPHKIRHLHAAVLKQSDAEAQAAADNRRARRALKAIKGARR